MPIEREDKFDVPVEFTVPDLSGVRGCAAVVGPVSHRLVAVYFDTSDFRLAARGVTLRRRRGGADPGWHLKLPEAKGTRLEITRPLTRSARTAPAELAELVLAYTRGAPLVPVAELETRRSVTRLLDAAGVVLVEIADDRVKGTVLTGDDPRVLRWREVEAELKAGDEALLKRVGKRLRRAGAHPAESGSKLGRLLGDLPAPAASTTTPASAVQSRDVTGSAGEVVLGYLRGQVQALLAQDPRVRLAEEDAVHQARVAARRLRSALKAFKRIVPDTDEVQRELRWLGEVLGEVRDLEVIRARFAERLDSLEPSLIVGPVRHRLGEDLLARERDAYDRVREVLSGERYFTLLDRLDDLVANPPLSALAAKNATGPLRRIVDRGWRRVIDAYDVAQQAEDREIAMHEVRKAAKRARYTAEAVGMGDAARRARVVQEVLGRQQDGVVAQNLLMAEAEAARQAGEDTFTYGVLVGLERAGAAQARESFPEVWARVG